MIPRPKVSLLERLAAFLLLLLCLPTFLLIALALLQFAGHPILTTDETLSSAGITTKTLRFSTAGPARDQFFKPLGRFLRQYNLDELPALLSILKGDTTFRDVNLWKTPPEN